MMLKLVLLASNCAAEIEAAVKHIKEPQIRGLSYLVLDLASSDGTRELLQQQFGQHSDTFIALDTTSISETEISRLLQRNTDAEYFLTLSPSDHLNIEALEKLCTLLEQERPKALVMGTGQWQGKPTIELPSPDRARAKALAATPEQDRLLELLPSRQRLLLRKDLEVAAPDTPGGQDPESLMAFWAEYEECLAAIDELVWFPAAPVRNKFGFVSAAPMIEALPAALARLKHQEQRRLERRFIWLSDLIKQSPADETDELLAAVRNCYTKLPRGLRKQARNHFSLIGRLFDAAHRKDFALGYALLNNAYATRSQHMLQALAGEIEQLHHELSVKLPTPDYLKSLYARLRHLS